MYSEIKERLKKMSNIHNEEMLEKFFEEFLEEGFSDWEADKLAHEKLETIPTPWG